MKKQGDELERESEVNWHSWKPPWSFSFSPILHSHGSSNSRGFVLDCFFEIGGENVGAEVVDELEEGGGVPSGFDGSCCGKRQILLTCPINAS